MGVLEYVKIFMRESYGSISSLDGYQIQKHNKIKLVKNNR